MRKWLFLAGIFAFVLVVRLVFAFQTPYFHYDAYQTYLEVETILETGKPLLYMSSPLDKEMYVGSPLFSCILAGGALFIPLSIALKVLPNIFISTLVIVVYFLAFRITKKHEIALIAAFMSGFAPIIYETTLHTLSSLTLSFPLLLLSYYYFMGLPKKHDLRGFLMSFLILTLLSPLSFILVLSILLSLFISRLEGGSIRRAEVEVGLFITFFTMWFQFIIYKKAFLEHGIRVIWQNVPESVSVVFFHDITLIEALYSIGFVPFILGAYIISKYLFQEKNREVHLLSSTALILGVLLWTRLLPLRLGLSILAVILILLVAQFLVLFVSYIDKTKIVALKPLFLISLLLVFAITSIVPTIALSQEQLANDIPRPGEIRTLEWLSRQEPGEVASGLRDGFIVRAIAKREVIIDKEFLFENDAEQRLKDIETIFTTPYKTDIIASLEKYGAPYIYISPRTAALYNLSTSPFPQDCFKILYDRQAQVYRNICTLNRVD
ncbi:MAG: hypothetical protein ABIH34_08210 [Nanoarchaeota archaeon]